MPGRWASSSRFRLFQHYRTGADVRYVGQRTRPTNVDDIPCCARVDASLSDGLARLDPAWKGAWLSVNATDLFDQRCFNAGRISEGFRRTVSGTLTDRW